MMNEPFKRNHDVLLKRLDLLTEGSILLMVFFLPISKALIEIGSMSAIACWLTGKVIRREPFLISRPLFLPYLAFLVLCLASLFYADTSTLEYRGFFKWLQYLGIFAVLHEQIRSPEKVSRLCFVFLLSMTLVSINGFYQLVFGTDFLRGISLDPGRITRMKSSLGAANNLASFYLFALPVSLFYAFKSPGKTKLQRTLPALAALFFLAAFIATFSRGAFLGLVFSVIFYSAIRNRKFLLFFLGSLILILGLVKPLRENFVTSLNFKDITVNERVRVWEAALDLGLERPFFGYGINTFYETFPAIELSSGSYRGYAHNSYLQMFVELGLAGLALFIFPFLISLKNFFITRGELYKDMLFVGFLAFLIQACVDNSFYAMQPACLFWVFWGLLTAPAAEAEANS